MYLFQHPDTDTPTRARRTAHSIIGNSLTLKPFNTQRKVGDSRKHVAMTKVGTLCTPARSFSSGCYPTHQLLFPACTMCQTWMRGGQRSLAGSGLSGLLVQRRLGLMRQELPDTDQLPAGEFPRSTVLCEGADAPVDSMRGG